MCILATGTIMAQQIDGITPPLDKKKIALRPNSRDYGSVILNNSHQRQSRVHNKAKLMKNKPVLKNKMIKSGKNSGVKKQQMQQRRQIMRQQRNLRK